MFDSFFSSRITLILTLTVVWNFQFESDTGSLILEGSGVLQCRVTRDAIGKFISFQCVPVRDDGIVGEPRTCMGVERVRPGKFLVSGFDNFACLSKSVNQED